MTLRSAFLIACSLGLVADAVQALQTSTGTGVPVESLVPIDNQKGRYLNFEVGQIKPILLHPSVGPLWVVNQAGNRLVAMNPSTLERLDEIPIGLGGASIAARPDSDELWVVDRVQSCVSVISTTTRSIAHTIRVGAEPHGIAFSPSGDRAWVTCSAVDRVDVIRTADYSVVKSIAIPAREPRGIVYSNNRAWVVSFLSGNNTSGQGSSADPLKIATVSKVEGPGVTPLPDRDLFAIRPGATPELDGLDASLTRTGLGTTLFDIDVRPDTRELWIPNTDALNAQHKGEKSFVEGQVVSNRITIVDAGGVQPTRFIDLDAIAPAGVKCAQPTGLAFDPVRPRVYVCGYGSDLVAVLQIQPDSSIIWAGHIRLPPKASYPRGTAPRACTVSHDGRFLWVFNRNDSSVARIDLVALPPDPTFAVDSPTPKAVGADNTSTEERLGRHLFTDARNSKSKTSSCASCHVDGHVDGVAWDLSNYLDPEGTPVDQMVAGLDVKGPLVTQSTRRMEESSPYHWRGEKRSINDFNDAFVSLLERETNGLPANVGPDFQYLRHYINRLAIPANPRESADRTFTAEEAEGAYLFQALPVLNGLTCAACHTLPLGTRGEVVAEFADGVLLSADVPQLRGVGLKSGPVFNAGGTFGLRPELGTGLTHAGGYASLDDVILREDPAHTGQQHFQLGAGEAQKIAAFLNAFDTGLAPSTTVQGTATAANVAAFRADVLHPLIEQARKGNCDLIFFRTPPPNAPPLFARTGMYLTRANTFRVATKEAARMSEAELLLEVANGFPITFVGVPPGMGLSHGLDRDMDGMWDVDEVRATSDPDNVDTDGDRYPDGYEVAYGQDPLVFDASFPGDTVPPRLMNPARLIYATTNTIKFEFDTTEASRVHVAINGGPALQRIPLDHMVDTEHWVVLAGLQPGTSYQISLEMRDPANNIYTDTTTTFSTLPRALPQPVSIDSIQLAVQSGPPVRIVGTVFLKSGATPAIPGYGVYVDVFRQFADGTVVAYMTNLWAPTGTLGKAEVRVPLPIPADPISKYFFVVRRIEAPVGAPAYVSAYDKECFDSIVY